MAASENTVRETFIPFKASDVIEMCLRDAGTRLSGKDQRSFRDLAKMLSHIFHHEFHETLTQLKAAYAPFDPDADTRPLDLPSPEEMDRARQKLFSGITHALEKANYHRLSRDELEAALADSSLFKLRLDVDFDDFEDIVFFARGERRREEDVRKGFKRTTVQFDVYERVAIYVRFKDQAYFDQQKRKDLDFVPGSTVLKLFRNVPKADLEILFPNVKIKMRTIDKLLIGIPAAIGGIVVLATKLMAPILLAFGVVLALLKIKDTHPTIDTKALVAAGAGLGAAIGYIFKQISSYKNRKIRFLKTLSDQLYFKNLDNNAGVLFHLMSGAEDEELKESILAYYFLSISAKPLTAEALDHRIEDWFEKQHGWQLDFDVQDALEKLDRLQLAHETGGAWSVISINQANQQLDALWDGYFDFSEAR